MHVRTATWTCGHTWNGSGHLHKNHVAVIVASSTIFGRHKSRNANSQMAAPFLSGFGESDVHLRSCRISFIEMIGRAIAKAANQLHATVIMDHVDKVCR